MTTSTRATPQGPGTSESRHLYGCSGGNLKTARFHFSVEKVLFRVQTSKLQAPRLQVGSAAQRASTPHPHTKKHSLLTQRDTLSRLASKHRPCAKVCARHIPSQDAAGTARCITQHHDRAPQTPPHGTALRRWTPAGAALSVLAVMGSGGAVSPGLSMTSRMCRSWC